MEKPHGFLVSSLQAEAANPCTQSAAEVEWELGWFLPSSWCSLYSSCRHSPLSSSLALLLVFSSRLPASAVQSCPPLSIPSRTLFPHLQQQLLCLPARALSVELRSRRTKSSWWNLPRTMGRLQQVSIWWFIFPLWSKKPLLCLHFAVEGNRARRVKLGLVVYVDRSKCRPWRVEQGGAVFVWIWVCVGSSLGRNSLACGAANLWYGRSWHCRSPYRYLG